MNFVAFFVCDKHFCYVSSFIYPSFIFLLDVRLISIIGVVPRSRWKWTKGCVNCVKTRSQNGKKKALHVRRKAAILREHIESHVPVSDLAEKYGVHPNAVYKWKKQMYESASGIFSNKSKKGQGKISAQEELIRQLEQTLAQRESLIAELVADNIELKKTQVEKTQ